jgi:hypothetical protein
LISKEFWSYTSGWQDNFFSVFFTYIASHNA